MERCKNFKFNEDDKFIISVVNNLPMAYLGINGDLLDITTDEYYGKSKYPLVKYNDLTQNQKDYVHYQE